MPIEGRGYERHKLRLIGRLAVGPDVLDIGFAQQPNPWLRHFHTVGVDLNRSREPSGYAEEIVGDAMCLDVLLHGHRFNTIACGNFIEHIEEPYRFLRSLHPHLCEGGRLIMTTPNPLGFPQIFFEMLRSKRFYYTREHLYAFTPRWAVRLLESAGFLVRSVRPVGLQLLCCAPWCPTFMSHDVIYMAEPRRGA